MGGLKNRGSYIEMFLILLWCVCPLQSRQFVREESGYRNAGGFQLAGGGRCLSDKAVMRKADENLVELHLRKALEGRTGKAS